MNIEVSGLLIAYVIFYFFSHHFFNHGVMKNYYHLPKAEWNCFEHTNGQCTAYNYKGE